MFKKLLKYDLKYLFRKTSMYFLIIVFSSIFARLINLIPRNLSFVNIGINSFNFLFISSLVVFPFYVFATIVGRYRKNILSDEGYLTHTLPVSTSKIVLSKLVSNLILMVSVVLTIILLSIIAYSNGNIFSTIVILLEEIFNVLLDSSGLSILLFFLLILIVILSLVMGTVIIPLAQTMSILVEDRRSIMTVIFLVIIVSAIEFGGTVFFSLILYILGEHILSLSGICIALGLVSVLECIAIVGMYFLILLILKRRLNLK